MMKKIQITLTAEQLKTIEKAQKKLYSDEVKTPKAVKILALQKATEVFLTEKEQQNNKELVQ